MVRTGDMNPYERHLPCKNPAAVIPKVILWGLCLSSYPPGIAQRKRMVVIIVVLAV